mmetsp:Transcript_27730/g.94413  ORF Transcript_27730/g.94413 Transcript_27730/m.94413 type:complete len:406 (-) Transcript_27730:22-1239(-)
MMRWLIAAIVLARFADSSSCSVRDPRKNDSPAKRSKQVDIFVAGVEGSGHHGVVLGLLQPLIKHTMQIESAEEKACIKTGEMPFYEMDRGGKGARCVARGNVGWESFPSKRRVFENERYAMLYESPDCLAGNVPAGRFPGRWNKLKEPDSCYRCGGWRATLEDLYVRHARSDRLSVAAFQRGFPSLKVIFLWRNFIHSVFSHPPWDGGIRGHAMMLAAHAAALADDARNMTNGSFRVLRYEALQNPRSYSEAAEAIVDFLGYAPSMPVREAAALARLEAKRAERDAAAAAARGRAPRDAPARRDLGAGGRIRCHGHGLLQDGARRRAGPRRPGPGHRRGRVRDLPARRRRRDGGDVREPDVRGGGRAPLRRGEAARARGRGRAHRHEHGGRARGGLRGAPRGHVP